MSDARTAAAIARHRRRHAADRRFRRLGLGASALGLTPAITPLPIIVALRVVKRWRATYE